MPTDDELRNISNKKDWSRQEKADYTKLRWLSQRIIDVILKFPRVIDWARHRNAPEPDTRIGRARQRAREDAQEKPKNGQRA